MDGDYRQEGRERIPVISSLQKPPASNKKAAENLCIKGKREGWNSEGGRGGRRKERERIQTGIEGKKNERKLRAVYIRYNKFNQKKI